MRKKVFYQTVLILMTALLMTLPYNEESSQTNTTYASSDNCSIENTKFLAGEEITYLIQYQWNLLRLNAGEAVFKIEDTGDQYHITLHGETFGAVEWFYRVNDRFESFIDKKTLLPTMFIREVEEGKYRKYNKALFDQKGRKIISYEGRTKDDLERTDYETTSCMHDMLSILYHVRNLDFNAMQPGDTIPVEVFLENKYPLTVHVLEKDVQKRVKGYGKFMTHLFSPEVIVGHIFKESDQMRVYVSADSNTLPMVIESPVSVGKIRAVIQDYKGLRYKLDPMVE